MEQNINKFRAALTIGANPLNKDNMFLTVFEKALETPGCCEYIKECLQHGCDPNYVSKINVYIMGSQSRTRTELKQN